MRDIDEMKSAVEIRDYGWDYFCGIIRMEPLDGAFVVASWRPELEHVSVSWPERYPTRQEMCVARDIFWRDSETVTQLHFPKEDHNNDFPNCLHLCRQIGRKIPKFLRPLFQHFMYYIKCISFCGVIIGEIHEKHRNICTRKTRT